MSGDRREAVEAALRAHGSGLIAALFSDPDGAVVTEAQTEAVSSYAARQHLALLDHIGVLEAECDALAAKVARVEALANALVESGSMPGRFIADDLRAALGDHP